MGSHALWHKPMYHDMSSYMGDDMSHYMNIALICTKFLGYVPYSPPEGSVSQNFDLGPCVIFLSYVEYLENDFFHYYLRFVTKNQQKPKLKKLDTPPSKRMLSSYFLIA